MTARRLPSVVGCAIGFGFAGCGAGVVPGTWVSGQLRGPVLGPDPTPLAELQWAYGSVYVCSLLMMVLGGVLGVRYARAAQRRPAQPPTPSTSPRPPSTGCSTC